jgi:hypothetical protein
MLLGSLPGIAPPDTVPYIMAISLRGILGTTGIEDIGVRSTQKLFFGYHLAIPDRLVNDVRILMGTIIHFAPGNF